MIEKTGLFVLCGLLVITGAACGFKSDLFIPGQPQKAGQYDSKSLKDLGDKKLKQLQTRQSDETSAAPPASDLIVPDSRSSDGADVPDNGIIVELPTAEDIALEKADNRKKPGIRKQATPEN